MQLLLPVNPRPAEKKDLYHGQTGVVKVLRASFR
jgi:hypothetical protein